MRDSSEEFSVHLGGYRSGAPSCPVWFSPGSRTFAAAHCFPPVTSVRPVLALGYFVAASSGVRLYQALWRREAGKARKFQEFRTSYSMRGQRGA